MASAGWQKRRCEVQLSVLHKRKKTIESCKDVQNQSRTRKKESKARKGERGKPKSSAKEALTDVNEIIGAKEETKKTAGVRGGGLMRPQKQKCETQIYRTSDCAFRKVNERLVIGDDLFIEAECQGASKHRRGPRTGMDASNRD